MKKIKILVTGAGSGVGQSIVKALNIAKCNIEVILVISITQIQAFIELKIL